MQRAEVGGSCEDDKRHTSPGESALLQSVELEMKEYKSDRTSTDQSLEKQEQGNNLLEKYGTSSSIYQAFQNKFVINSIFRQCLPGE